MIPVCSQCILYYPFDMLESFDPHAAAAAAVANMVVAFVGWAVDIVVVVVMLEWQSNQASEEQTACCNLTCVEGLGMVMLPSREER